MQSFPAPSLTNAKAHTVGPIMAALTKVLKCLEPHLLVWAHAAFVQLDTLNK